MPRPLALALLVLAAPAAAVAQEVGGVVVEDPYADIPRIVLEREPEPAAAPEPDPAPRAALPRADARPPLAGPVPRGLPGLRPDRPVAPPTGRDAPVEYWEDLLRRRALALGALDRDRGEDDWDDDDWDDDDWDDDDWEEWLEDRGEWRRERDRDGAEALRERRKEAREAWKERRKDEREALKERRKRLKEWRKGRREARGQGRGRGRD